MALSQHLDPENRFGITLIMPSGNQYDLGPDDFTLDPPELLKADKPIPAGSRWITVHPNGREEKGQPVLVQETHHGSGVFHVIGGAGGKLNYLKLHGIAPESSYKQQAAERRAAKQQEAKQQRARDKEAGIATAKKQAREAVQIQKREHEAKFINTVAGAMGWTKEDLEPRIPDELSDGAKKRLLATHHTEILRRAHEAVDLQRQQLLTDADARADSEIGAIPFDTSNPDKLSVADLDDTVPAPDGGLGYAPHYEERAKAKGMTDDDLKAEVGEAKAERQALMSEAQRTAAEARGETAKVIANELSQLQEPVTKETRVALTDAKKTIDLLKAQKQLRGIQRQATEANKELTTAKEVKAYNLDVGEDPDLDEKVMHDLENDLRTIRTKAFLSEVAKVSDNPEEALGRHIGVGSFNAVNALALAAGGSALVDRSVVDVLGIEGAARVLARRLHTDLPQEDVERITEGLQDFHLKSYMDQSKEALQEAQELHEAAREIGAGEAAHADDLPAAMELNLRRQDAISKANKILGQTLGEMETNAALVVAMKQGKNDKPLEVPLGGISAEDAIKQARAIGLQRGDYTVDKVGNTRILTVKPDGLDRLSKPVSRDDIEQVQRNLDIIGGKYDEKGWLPLGVSKRPDLAMDVKPGVAERLAQPFQPGHDLTQSLKDYIGGRAADGDTPADILADVQSSDFVAKSGDPDAYRAALDAVAPLKDAKGKTQRAEALADTFDRYADAYVASLGGGRTALNKQTFEVDNHAAEALHRALSAEPAGVAAYKQIGELTSHDQRTLREFFYKNVARESEEAADLRHEHEQHLADEPEKSVEDMFGDTVENPQWSDWRAKRDELAAKVGAASLDWPKYADAMRGYRRAYESVQDLIRSKVSGEFGNAYNRLRPQSPLKMGRSVIRGNLNHLDAVDPAAREARMAKEREMIDSLRNRAGGKYASGAVSDKLDELRDRKEAFHQAQMGFFSSENDDMFGGGGEVKEKPMAADERHTLGHVAERQIAKMMGSVGANFKPGQPLRVGTPSMDGDGIARQRAIKLIAANKRVALAAGVGSGKSLIQLAAFTHLQQQGKAKRGLFLVPSIVQGQFSGQALKFLEPGKFNWHIEPGASREERIAAYKNPKHDFAVMTHAGFRDDMLHLGAQHSGKTIGEMRDHLDTMTPAQRKDWIKGIMSKEGIDFDYLGVDEGHNLLNRAGKENSGMANVVDALSAHTPYYVNATADPVKNDASEVFSLLQKMDPDRYTDRDEFMRRYGVDTEASKAGLKRELARFSYPSKIVPQVRADKKEIPVDISGEQRSSLDTLDKHFAKARLARMTGGVDVDAMKEIAPHQFEGAPEDQHEAIARELSKNLGILKGSAMSRVIDNGSAKLDAVAKLAGERKGKPGIVFAHSLTAVQSIKDRLEKEGHKVTVLTGGDSAQDKAKKIRAYRDAKDGGILVASDAGSTGANLQTGQWVAQYDTPQTAMTHAQRNGRIYRIGQKNDVELMDLVANHPHERKARERLKTKYELRDLVTSPMESLEDDPRGIGYFLKKRQADEQQSLF